MKNPDSKVCLSAEAIQKQQTGNPDFWCYFVFFGAILSISSSINCFFR